MTRDNDDYDEDDFDDKLVILIDLATLVHALDVGVQHLLVVLRSEKAILAPAMVLLYFRSFVNKDFMLFSGLKL